MKRLDLEQDAERYLKALIYGRPGTGKTGFGVSADDPLILLSERQGYEHVVDAARRLKKDLPPVLFMENVQDYRNVLRALHGDRTLPFVVQDEKGTTIVELTKWPRTLVIDSLTDACQRIIDEIRTQSPPKVGKDGLPNDSERFWNVLSDRVAKLVYAFRDAPMNVVFLCLLDDRMVGDDSDDEDKKSRWVGPQLPMRKMPGLVQAAVNVVGVTYRKNGAKDAAGDRVLEYGISTTGPDFMELKPFRPLRDSEVMDFSSWTRRINGQHVDLVPVSPPSSIEAIVAPDNIKPAAQTHGETAQA